MAEFNSYTVNELQSIMDDYAQLDIEFTEVKEWAPSGKKEWRVNIVLGQSLDILGYEEVYYDIETKGYFLMFSTFLAHLGKATNTRYTGNVRFISDDGKIVQMELEEAEETLG